MRELTQREYALVRFLEFIGLDFELLQITQTGLEKGYTDATVGFREFVKRCGIHDFNLQQAGEQFKKVIDVFLLTGSSTENAKITFQRPAAKGGKMYRVSMIAGLRQSLHIHESDLLLFFVRDNQLHITNLTYTCERIAATDLGSQKAKPAKGAAILQIAKDRLMHVMESMPECEAEEGHGARVSEIAELSGMTLQKERLAFVSSLLDEMCFQQTVVMLPTNPRKYRLCP